MAYKVNSLYKNIHRLFFYLTNEIDFSGSDEDIWEKFGAIDFISDPTLPDKLKMSSSLLNCKMRRLQYEEVFMLLDYKTFVFPTSTKIIAKILTGTEIGWVTISNPTDIQILEKESTEKNVQ